MTSSYNPDHQGVRQFLNSRMMIDTVIMVAERIKARAMAISPIGDPIEDHDKHPGLYISSFHVRSHRYGGATNDRAEAIMYNDASDAFWVEYGHPGREPYHVIRRAAFEVRLLC